MVVSTWLHEVAHLAAAVATLRREAGQLSQMTPANLTGKFSRLPVIS